MVSSNQRWSRAAGVVIFALAMAWVEAAAVLYLRTLVGRLEPYQPNPLPLADGLGRAELIREAATLVMLSAVGWLAGNTWHSRVGLGLLAFGVWDIGYYLFLVPLTGWPRSVFDWDILFLLPLPWWGPVLAPTLIALLMILGGSLLAAREPAASPGRFFAWTLCAGTAGVLLALYTFMADSLGPAPSEMPAGQAGLPGPFRWPLFLLAWGLMALPVIDLARTSRRKTRGQPPA